LALLGILEAFLDILREVLESLRAVALRWVVQASGFFQDFGGLRGKLAALGLAGPGGAF
jgi:hypothetical protein